MTRTESSSPAVIAKAPTSQSLSTGHGAAFQRASVVRVCWMPWTSARSETAGIAEPIGALARRLEARGSVWPADRGA